MMSATLVAVDDEYPFPQLAVLHIDQPLLHLLQRKVVQIAAVVALFLVSALLL